jgi:hypothetical protein
MSEKIKTGGPAYPRENAFGGATGMSLRDYFAAQVAAGDAATENGWGTPDAAGALKRARVYYMVADAMLLAREENPLGTPKKLDADDAEQ